MASSTDFPAKAERIERSMRRSAKSSVPFVSAARGARERRAEFGREPIDFGALRFVQKVAVGGQGARGRLKQAARFDLLLAQFARAHVVRRLGVPVLQHPDDFFVREAVGGLHRDARFDARLRFAGGNGQEPVGVDLEGDANTGRTRRHRGNAAQLEARERPHASTTSRSPCTT